MSLESWKARPSSRNLNTTGKPVEDDRYIPNAMKRTRTMQRKIAWKKLHVQTANKIIRLTQELVVFTKKKKKLLSWNTRGMFPFWKLGEFSGAIWEKAATPPLHRGWIEPMTTPNIEHLRKLIKLEANDWPKFQDHLKKLHSVEFYQTPAQQQVANGERSNVVLQTKTHVGSITPTRTTPKSAKSPSKQRLHKSPICPQKALKIE